MTVEKSMMSMTTFGAKTLKITFGSQQHKVRFLRLNAKFSNIRGCELTPQAAARYYLL